MLKVSKEIFIAGFKKDKLSIREFADKHSLLYRGVWARVQKYIKKGFLLPSDIKSPPEPEISSDQLVELYKTEGLLAISKLVNKNTSTIRTRLLRAGVVFDSERLNEKTGLTKGRRRRGAFSITTKRARFEAQKGICQECNLLVGDGFNFRHKDACYHHNIPCYKGGDHTLENCMLLHSSCHNNPVVFERLHGIKQSYS